MESLSANVLEFCGRLRGDLGFRIGHAEAHDALRALEIVGVFDLGRVRDALRAVCCTKQEESAAFDRAFDAFFLARSRGVPQPLYKPRVSRPDQSGDGAGRGERRPDASVDAAEQWESMRARYSPAAGAASAPLVTADEIASLSRAASGLTTSVRLGRLRRWRPQSGGPRFDMRRTMRASLRTGGDAVFLHRLGHPLRNPRFVLLIDGSRSMASHGTLMLRFAYALCRRWRRAHVFLFSTAIHDVTRAIRASARAAEHRLDGLGEAWGGGTRIGANLAGFVRERAALLTDDTVVVVYSDGLDVGDSRLVSSAMRELRRRSAMVFWVNPLVGTTGFTPTARGMAAMLPHVDALLGAREAIEFGGLARAARRAS